jgi:hypothetical protein
MWQRIDGTGVVYIFGFEFKEFYKNVIFRLIPLFWSSIYLVSTTKKLLDIKENLYLATFLVALLTFVDAFTHISNIYSFNFYLPVYGAQIWFDKVMHFAEGILLTWTLAPIIKRFLVDNVKAFKKSAAWSYFITLAFTSIFFILWEIVELLIDRFIIHHNLLISGWTDTNEDLMFAYLGVIPGVVVLELYRRYSIKKTPDIRLQTTMSSSKISM